MKRGIEMPSTLNWTGLQAFLSDDTPRVIIAI